MATSTPRTMQLTEKAAAVVERRSSGKIRVTSKDSHANAVAITLLVLVAITVFTFVRMDYGHVDLATAANQSLSDFWAMIAQPALDPPLGASHFTWDTLAQSTITTIAITAITTIVSAITAFFLGLAAAQNLSNRAVSNVVKAFIAVIRAVPTILWVLVFTVAIGLGADAAVLGISLHSLAYLTKSYSETFEEVDEGAIEALRASGAGFWQIVFQAILPETVTKLLSWTFIRLEINFANAVAVGAFAGAGGIGFQLYQAGSRYYNLHEVGVIVYICVIVAFVLEFCSTRLRKRYIVNE
jgi:phosphonate transport system permease protein